MAVYRLPGLMDPHVHLRDPGTCHKEDWDTGTAAALAGGFTCVLDMPNNTPPVVDESTLGAKEEAARQRARCDWGLHLGAGAGNVGVADTLAQRVCGLKLYLGHTFGPLYVDEMDVLLEHARRWPASKPMMCHAEGQALAAAILAAHLAGRPLHVCHVSCKRDINLIRQAKALGFRLTCEVTPHHLFLHQDNVGHLTAGRAEVRPVLGTAEDCAALKASLDVIDCFATDHAPHTLAEKDSATPPPGYPGLETALPLYLGLVRDGVITLEDLIAKTSTNVRAIFGLPVQPDTFVDVDVDEEWVVHGESMHSRARWSPFEGWSLKGRVRRVVLRGQEAFREGKVLAAPGNGRNVCPGG